MRFNHKTRKLEIDLRIIGMVLVLVMTAGFGGVLRAEREPAEGALRLVQVFPQVIAGQQQPFENNTPPPQQQAQTPPLEPFTPPKASPAVMPSVPYGPAAPTQAPSAAQTEQPTTPPPAPEVKAEEPAKTPEQVAMPDRVEEQVKDPIATSQETRRMLAVRIKQLKKLPQTPELLNHIRELRSGLKQLASLKRTYTSQKSREKSWVKLHRRAMKWQMECEADLQTATAKQRAWREGQLTRSQNWLTVVKQKLADSKNQYDHAATEIENLHQSAANLPALAQN